MYMHQTPHLLLEPKEMKNLLDLVKSFGKNGIPLGTAFPCSPLLQIAMVVGSLQTVLGQLPPSAESSQDIVEDVEILLSPEAKW